MLPTPDPEFPVETAASRLIPGAYERRPVTPRQPGMMSGAAYGSPDTAGGPAPISPATIADRQMEGGGGVSQRRAVRSMAIASLIALAAWPAAAAPVSYRGFVLGTSTTEVMALATGVAPRDLKRIHDRPAVLDELTWRPPYRSQSTGRDSVASIVFSFLDNQLFRMAVDYDRSRTEGLTAADLTASLSSIYGPRLTVTTPPARKVAVDQDAPVTLARWGQEDATIVLTQSSYGSFGLVLTSTKLDVLARQAQANAVTLDAREAPAREAARVKADADAKRAAEAKTRNTNKDAFTP